MEVPSCESARYLPDSLVVRFDKKHETTIKEVIQPSEQLLRFDKDGSKQKIETDHRLRLFMDIFLALSGENRDDVEKEFD
jgi:hypothetical protein